MKKDFVIDHSANLRILAVEDDELMGPVLKRQLQAFASSVALVTDPKSFLVHMASDTPAFDLAVIDLGLPGLAGEHLISWIRSSAEGWIAALPILVVTGYPERAEEIVGANLGKVEILAKPYELDGLGACLRELFPPRFVL